MMLLPLLVLTGCTDPILPQDTEPTCETTIPSTWPDNGAVGVYHRGAVEFTLSEPDPTAVVLADFEGVQSTREGGLVVVYTPTEPLEPLTTYEVSLDYCRGTPSISFTTSALGSALSEDIDLEGRVYAADMTDLRYLSGDGVGQIVTTFIGDELLLQVVEATATSFQLRTALALDGGALTQDPCGRTVDLPSADFSDAPYFSHEASDVEVEAYDTTLFLEDFSAAGTFASDGTWVGGISASVTLDTREVAELLGLAAEDICLLAGNVGLECEDCEDGYPYCGTLVLQDMVAEEVDIEVVEITVLDESCQDDETSTGG